VATTIVILIKHEEDTTYEPLQSAAIRFNGSTELYERIDLLKFWSEVGFLFDPYDANKGELDQLIERIKKVEQELYMEYHGLDRIEAFGKREHCQEWRKMFEDVRLMHKLGICCLMAGH
jgi:hypothetical protein